MQDMERIFEINFGDIDKATGKPVVHEIHIDSDSFATKDSVLSLVSSSMFEHEGWDTDTSGK